MRDEAVDDSLAVAALKIIPTWFGTSKIIQKLYIALYADYGFLYFDEDSGDIKFGYNEMGIVSVNLDTLILIIILMKIILILLFLSDF